MIIDEKTLEEYNLLKEPHDARMLAKITKLSRFTIYNILKDGKCAAKVAAKFRKYYDLRKQEVSQATDND